MKFRTAEKIFDQAGGRDGLPTWTYNNEELTRLEQEQIFLRHWMFVGHVADIPNPGDYQCFAMARERAVVVRDQQGEVRAFHNLCRHRASRIVADDRGHCGNAFICPFHGWSYHLDGSLKNIPKSGSFGDIDKAEYGLKSLDCEIWHGLIFIRFDGDGASVAEQFAEAETEISLYRIDEMQPLGEPYQYKFDLDWKAVLDIDNEGYHVPVGHPELFDLVGATYNDQQLEGGLFRSSGSFAERKHRLQRNRDYVAALPDESYLPESHRQQWIYWGLFPGFVLTLFPDQIEVYQIYPTGYRKSVMAGIAYALPDDRASMLEARKINREINTEVGREDVRLIEWSAEGMRSNAYEGMLLSDLELGVAAFQNRLRRILPVVTLEHQPEAGTLKKVNARMRGERGNVAVVR